METSKELTVYDFKYRIFNNGKVVSPEFSQHMKRNNCERVIKERELNQRTTERGYKTVSLRQNGVTKHVKVHRLVALNFVENPKNKPQVNHIDLVKSNNHFSNLEWVTNEENRIHAIKNGVKIGRKKWTTQKE